MSKLSEYYIICVRNTIIGVFSTVAFLLVYDWQKCKSVVILIAKCFNDDILLDFYHILTLNSTFFIDKKKK